MTTAANSTDTRDIDQIRALLKTYEQALNTSDAALAASLYTDDGVFMPHFTPTSAGPAIPGAYEQIFKALKLAIAFKIDDISVEGDMAYALTRSEGQQTILAANSTGPEANRELFVFRRRQGAWKIAQYMFNKTSPAAV